ncbi:unnamed protein product [Caenorhabditis brenneri]
MSSAKYKRSKLKQYTCDDLDFKVNITDPDKPRLQWVLREDEKTYFYCNVGHMKTAKFYILSVDEAKKINGDKTMYESLTSYMAVRDKPIYLRQLPHPNTGDFGSRYFAEEVLEIIPLVLKQQGNEISDDDARLIALRQKYKPPTADIHCIIVHSDFLKILEEFDIDKSRLTILPDIYSESSIRIRRETGVTPFKTISWDMEAVMCPAQAIWQIFINCVGGLFGLDDPDLKRLIVACMMKFKRKNDVMVSQSIVDRTIEMIWRHSFYRDKKNPVLDNKYFSKEGIFDLIDPTNIKPFFFRIPRFRVFMPPGSTNENLTHLPTWVLRTTMVVEEIERFFARDQGLLKYTLLNDAEYFVPKEEMSRARSFFNAYMVPYFSLKSMEYRKMKRVLETEQVWEAALTSLKITKSKRPQEIRDYSTHKFFDRSAHFTPVDDLQKLSIELEGVEYVSNRYFMNENNKKSENSQYFLVKKDAKNAKKSMGTMENYYSDPQSTEFVVRTFAYDHHANLILVSEGLEIVRLALKRQKTLTPDKVEGLRKMRNIYPGGPDSCLTMPVSVFKKVISVFGVNQMITIVPDLVYKYTTQAASQNPSSPIYLINTNGEEMMFGLHCAIFLFSMVFCRTSFKIDEKTKECIEFKNRFHEILKYYIAIPEANLINKSRVEFSNTIFLHEVTRRDLGRVNLNFFHDDMKPTDIIFRETNHQPVEWQCEAVSGPNLVSVARFSYIMNGIQAFFPQECFEDTSKLLEALQLIVPSNLVQATLSLIEKLVDNHQRWEAGCASGKPQKITNLVAPPVCGDVRKEAEKPVEAQRDPKEDVEAEVFLILASRKPPPSETSSEPSSSEASTLEKTDPKKARMKKLKGIACGNCVQANVQCGNLRRELRSAQEKAKEYEEKAKKTEKLEKKLEEIEANNEFLKKKRKNADDARIAERKLKDEAVEFAAENKEKIENALQLEGELKEVQKKLKDKNKQVKNLEKQLTSLPSILEQNRALAESAETRKRTENEQKALRKQTENENEHLKKQLEQKTQKMEEEQRRVTKKFEKMEQEMAKMREIIEKLLTRNLHLEADNTDLKNTASQNKVQLLHESDKNEKLSAEKSVLQQEVYNLEYELRVLRNTEPSTSGDESSQEVGIPDTHCTICTQYRDSSVECENCHKVYHAKCINTWFEQKDARARCPNCQKMMLNKEQYPELGE